MQFGHHGRFGAEGHDDGARAAEGAGCVDGGQAGIPAAGGVEVCVVGRGGGAEGGQEVVAYSAGFERAAWLEEVEFEEDGAACGF